MNIDKLTNMLEDNRDLLNDITNRECSKEEAAQLPKLLFDIMSQAEAGSCDRNSPNREVEVEECEASTSTAEPIANDGSDIEKPKITSAQEIMRNLPKVWKVLIELLNHQKTKQVDLEVS